MLVIPAQNMSMKYGLAHLSRCLNNLFKYLFLTRRYSFSSFTHSFSNLLMSISSVISFTTGNFQIAMSGRLCRESPLGHTAKDPFAECRKTNTRQNMSTRQRRYLPCATRESTRQSCTRQNKNFTKCFFVCRVSEP